MDTLRLLYRRLRNDAPEAYNRRQLLHLLGSPIEALDAALRASLAGRDVPSAGAPRGP